MRSRVLHMFGWPIPFSIDARINRAYARSLTRHGPKPQGVFWNSTKPQKARFAALTAAIRADHEKQIGRQQMERQQNGRGQNGRGQHTPAPPVIADIGCGYGALLDYIDTQPSLAGWGYRGIDVTPAMVEACTQRFPERAACFTTGKAPPVAVDYCLVSGTFNLCLINDADRWQRYILESLTPCWHASRRGIALNLLCADKALIRNNIYYASRDGIIAALQQRFGAVSWHPTRQVKHDVTFLITRRN